MERKYKVFGQAIAKARKLKDLGQEELADKLNMSRAYISVLESGAKRVDPKHVPKIADALGLDRSKLYEVYFSCEIGQNFPYDFKNGEVTESRQNIDPEERLLYAYFDIVKHRYMESDEKDRANIRQSLESMIKKEEKKR